MKPWWDASVFIAIHTVCVADDQMDLDANYQSHPRHTSSCHFLMSCARIICSINPASSHNGKWTTYFCIVLNHYKPVTKWHDEKFPMCSGRRVATELTTLVSYTDNEVQEIKANCNQTCQMQSLFGVIEPYPGILLNISFYIPINIRIVKFILQESVTFFRWCFIVFLSRG